MVPLIVFTNVQIHNYCILMTALPLLGRADRLAFVKRCTDAQSTSDPWLSWQCQLAQVSHPVCASLSSQWQRKRTFRSGPDSAASGFMSIYWRTSTRTCKTSSEIDIDNWPLGHGTSMWFTSTQPCGSVQHSHVVLIHALFEKFGSEVLVKLAWSTSNMIFRANAVLVTIEITIAVVTKTDWDKL